MNQLLHPQQVLAGYEIETLLGKGGMGEVYLARQLNLDRLVALKVLPPDIAQRDPEYARRFVEEAQAAGSLNHPNIIAVYNVGKAPLPDAAPGGPEIDFFAMEYVDGKSVREFMEQHPVLPQTFIDRVMVGMTKALIYAEAHGIVHRDIKPDNIMITTDGVVKLADLGLALRVDDSNESTNDSMQLNNKVLGTPLYMSPEQARGVTIDVRSDQYSLGATLYHMLTGQPPYHGKRAINIMRAHVFEPVPDPKKINPIIPDAWRQICMTLLAKEPHERYANCQALRAAIIIALQSSETTKATQPVLENGRHHRPQRRSKTAKRPTATRNLTVAIGVIGAIALIVFMGPWNSIQSSDVTDNPSTQTSMPPIITIDTDQVTTAPPAQDPSDPITKPNDPESGISQLDSVTHLSLARSDDENDGALRANLHREGDHISVMYGTDNDKWFLQRFYRGKHDDNRVWSTLEFF